ncbi:flagellar basal body P-ring formation protein FlgA [bacterium]|nr:flagellar basal body P-ring formation protein FlgA [bacterium]
MHTITALVRMFKLAITTLLTLLAQPIAAMDLSQLQAEAVSYVSEQLASNNANTRVAIKAEKMDPRLQLRHCDKPLQFAMQSANRNNRRSLVKASCTSNTQAWSVFVPVVIQRWGKVVVARHPIARGQTLSINDLAVEERELARTTANYLPDVAHATGRVAGRTINAGQAINQQWLRKALWVKRGDEITIVAAANGIQVRVPGIAMMDGREAEQITVKNRSSKRLVKARVTARGEVQASM